GKQWRVAPDVLRACFDVGPGQPREVVTDLQRPETLGTRVVRAQLDRGAALPAGQAGGVTEAEGRVGLNSHGARPLSPIFPSGHLDQGPDLAPRRALASPFLRGCGVVPHTIQTTG